MLLSWPGGGQHVAGSKANAYANRFAIPQRYAFYEPHPHPQHDNDADHHPYALANDNRDFHSYPHHHFHANTYFHPHEYSHRQQYADRYSDAVAFEHPQRDACAAFSYPLTFLFSHHTQYA